MFTDAKAIMRSRKQKNRKNNGQKIKKTHSDLQNTTHNTKY